MSDPLFDYYDDDLLKDMMKMAGGTGGTPGSWIPMPSANVSPSQQLQANYLQQIMTQLPASSYNPKPQPQPQRRYVVLDPTYVTVGRFVGRTVSGWARWWGALFGVYCEAGAHWYVFRRRVKIRDEYYPTGPNAVMFYCSACWVAKQLLGDKK